MRQLLLLYGYYYGTWIYYYMVPYVAQAPNQYHIVRDILSTYDSRYLSENLLGSSVSILWITLARSHFIPLEARIRSNACLKWQPAARSFYSL